MIVIDLPAPAVDVLFERDVPNHPILFSSLSGSSPGELVADKSDHPTEALLRTPSGFAFHSKNASHEFVSVAVKHLQATGPVVIVARQSKDAYPYPDIVIPRLEFLDADLQGSRIREWVQSLPEGFSIKKMDQALLERCEWRDLILQSYGTLDRFFESGYGFCLLQGEEIVSESYGAFVGGGAVEIGVTTNEAYQGKGYGTTLCAHLVGEIRARGDRPYWSCDQVNFASASVARKLGFQIERSYDFYGYRPMG